MSDIKELLDRMGSSLEAPPSAETVEADLRRGRAALARRRRGRAIGFSLAGMVAAAALAVTALVAGNPGGTNETAKSPPASSQPASSQPASSQPASSKGAGSSVRLVAYHGDQLEGFIVDQVPDGWYLQGSNTFRLTIAPQGDTSSPDAFEGKLVVMLLSSSAPKKLPAGEPVKVGEQDGVISHGPPADTLTYDDGAGHFVQIQAWTAPLGWSDEQLTSFAEGVQVTADAEPGVG